MRVYITRRALKHVVESRKEQVLIRHTEEEALEAVCFALDHMPETIIHFDKFEYEPPTYCYQKDFAPEGKPMLRIALELRAGRLEIKSIHFKKRK